MKIIVISVFILIYLLMNYYIGNNIFKLLKFFFKNINIYVFNILFSLIILISILSFRKLSGNIGSIINYIGSFYMGLLVYLTILFLLKDFLRLIFGNSSKLNIIGISFAIIISLALSIFGIYNASKIKSISYNIKDDDFKNSYSIALIADLHLGAVGSEKNLKKVIAGLNEMEPDLICIAGDMFNDDFNTIKNPKELSNLLKSVKTKYGIYMTLGNHDSGATYKKMLEFIKESNIKILNDEAVTINNDFILIGRVDSSSIGGYDGLKRCEITEVLNGIDQNKPIVVIDHNPIHIKEYNSNINLLLSGHTHKGQIFPANLVTKSMYVVDYGLYESAQYPTTIVTSGAGTWGMPMRIGSNSEVVNIKIN